MTPTSPKTPTSPPKPKTPTTPMAVVVKSLGVLSAVGQSRGGITLLDLHRDLDIPLASMHRILATLEHERYLSRSAATKRYTLGSAARDLTGGPDSGSWLIAAPEPMIDLGRETGETVLLTRLVDSRVVCVALVESVHNLRLFARVGQDIPLHAAASARVILGFQSPERVRELLGAEGWESFTEETPRNVEEVLARLAGVRERGFDVCDSELDANVWAVAAPVFDAAGMVEYGLTLAAATARMPSEESRSRATDAVVRAAHRLSAGTVHASRGTESERVSPA